MRRCYCPKDGDLTERLHDRDDARFCPDCGETLTCILSEAGGETVTKSKKLKVMHEVHEVTNDAPKLKESKEPEVAEVKTNPDVERAFQALKGLGGTATSPKLAEKLGFEGETRRDKARALMAKLIEQKRVKKHKQAQTDETARKREYVYSVVVEAAA